MLRAPAALGGECEWYTVYPADRAPYCSETCPPGWYLSYRDCHEPTGVPTVAGGCPGMFRVSDEDGNKWCDVTCPPGWASGYHGAVKECVEQPPAPPPPDDGPPSNGKPPSPRPTPIDPEQPPPPEQAAVGLSALPTWAYVAGGALLLGAALYARS